LGSGTLGRICGSGIGSSKVGGRPNPDIGAGTVRV
jgi:hypothetical protein